MVAALVTSSAAGRPRVFLARRSRGSGHGGLWELPGGKVEEREEPEAALVREIGEELGVALVIEGSVRRYESSLSGRPFLFLVFPSRFASEEFRLSAHDRWGYFGADELGGLELAPLDGPSLRDWAARLEG